MFRRRFLIILVPTFVLLLSSGANAQQVQLWPGVTFERDVQFTLHGPVAISILTGPRPGGTTTLAPILSSNSLSGRETVTAMQRSIRGSATVAGVNGDFSAFSDGRPSGIVMRGGQLESPPTGGRSSLGILPGGTLDVRRIGFFGTWKGAGQRRVLNDLNQEPEDNQISLFTSAWGAATPSVTGSIAAILFPFPWAVPGADLVAPVVELASVASVPIPPGGAVLVARGTAAAALAGEAPVGSSVAVQLLLRPEWPGVADAIGGGPQIVRDGVPVFRANEAFTTSQLQPRAPRTAVGQLADGRVILVAVDGRQPGYSVGLTNFELAQTIVRLGAVTGMALDAGGSTTMAFDGQLLNRPSDGRERPIANALAFLYTGVYVQPAVSVVSPDGDGVADRQSLRYKLVKPSTVNVTLTSPDGTVAYTAAATQLPGSYAVPFPPPVTPPFPTQPTAAARSVAAKGVDGPAQGRWKLAVSATDDVGQVSEMTQAFLVNSTIGFLGTEPRKLFLPPTGRDLRIGWQQTKDARLVVTLEKPTGEVVRTLATRRYGPGPQGVTWNGLDRQRKAVKGGKYVVHAVARNALGTIELKHDFRVQRIVGP